MKFERVLRVPRHWHFQQSEQTLNIQNDITEALNAHIIDYSDPHHNFTGLTANYIPKKSGAGVADSIISDDGATASVAGHIDIAATKSIYMDGIAVIKCWSANQAIAIGKMTGADKLACSYFGGLCGYQQIGNYFNGQGYSCGRKQTGIYFSGQGAYCGYRQKGSHFSGQAYYCGREQIGNYFSGQGRECGLYQTGLQVNGYGYLTLRYNDADYATAIGSNSFNNFDEDVANEKEFDFGDIDVANDRITIVGHGFGANNNYRNLKFTQGTSNVPGVTTGTIHQFKIISADIVEIITDVITGQGTGTGHKLTPQFIYTESTAVGYNSEPDAAYQIMLGSENITWIKTHGSFRAEGGVLCLKEITTPSAITDYGKIYTKNDNCLYFQDGAGTEHKVAFV